MSNRAPQPKYATQKTVYLKGIAGTITDRYYDWGIRSWYYFVDFSGEELTVIESGLSIKPPPSKEEWAGVLAVADYVTMALNRNEKIKELLPMEVKQQ